MLFIILYLLSYKAHGIFINQFIIIISIKLITFIYYLRLSIKKTKFY